MKRVVTLLIAAAAFSSSFAQYSEDMEEARRIVLGERKDSRSTYPTNDPKDIVLGRDERRVYDRRDDRYPDRYPSTSRSRTEQVNREYDAKIRSIRNNPRLSSAEKERIIRGLNNERARRIREINNDNRRYSDKKRYEDRRYDDRRYDRRDDCDDDYKNNKNKKYKGNNGNHYGWQKGKGNPHKRG